MPKVPVYDSQIRSQAAPDVRIDANTYVDSFQSPLKGALDQAPKYFSAYEEQKRKADQIALTEADAKLSKLETDLLYDKDVGVTNLQGKSAFDAPKIVAEGYNKGAKEIEDSLSNDEQKIAFQKLQLDRGVSIDRTVQKHVGNEIIKYDNATSLNYIKNEQDAAIAAYNDPARVALSIQRQDEAVRQYAQRNGLPPEEADQKAADLKSKTHAQVINRMLTNDEDMAAEAYYKAVKADITGDDLINVEKQIESGSLRGKSQRFVDDVTKRKLSETDALAEARKIEDPKLRDATYERVKMEYNIRDAAEKKQVEDWHIAALNYIDAGNGKDVTKVAGWDKMTVGQRNSLQEYAQKKAEGRDIQTNYQTLYDLKTMASIPEMRDKFIKMNLMEKRNELNNSDFKTMVNLQTELRKGSSKGQAQADGFRSDNQVVKDAFTAAGLPAQNKEKLALFNSRVESEQMVMQERLGRKLNNEELKKVANQQAMEIVTKEGWLWDSKKNLYEISDEELKDIPYKGVPAADKLKIENALKKAGKKVDQESVRQMYILKTMKDRALGK